MLDGQVYAKALMPVQFVQTGELLANALSQCCNQQLYPASLDT
jgi:hypothetical protein